MARIAALTVLAVLGGLALYWIWPGDAGTRPAQVLFLGDSLTRRGDWDSLLGKGRVANAGVDGDTSRGALRRLTHLLDPPPAKVFIMIGINELGQAAPDSPQVHGLLENQARMLGLLKDKAPQARGFLLSLLPVNSRMIGGWISNQTIIEVNRRLKVLAAERGHAYLDLHAAMKDEAGDLDRRYTDDGLHLSPAGYRVWKQVVGPYL